MCREIARLGRYCHYRQVRVGLYFADNLAIRVFQVVVLSQLRRTMLIRLACEEFDVLWRVLWCGVLYVGMTSAFQNCINCVNHTNLKPTTTSFPIRIPVSHVGVTEKGPEVDLNGRRFFF